MGTVSAVAGVASMLSSIQQGRAQQQQANYQAKIAELNGRRDAIRLNEDLIKTLAMNNVSAAAGGLQSAGTVVEAQKENIQKAEEELSVIDFNKTNAASAARQSGANANSAGWGQALNTGVGVLSSAYQRKAVKDAT